MSNHTPGPWQYSTIAYQITGFDGENVCSLNGMTQRNAAIIIAAPELLKALRLIEKRLQESAGGGRTIKSRQSLTQTRQSSDCCRRSRADRWTLKPA